MWARFIVHIWTLYGSNIVGHYIHGIIRDNIKASVSCPAITQPLLFRNYFYMIWNKIIVTLIS